MSQVVPIAPFCGQFIRFVFTDSDEWSQSILFYDPFLRMRMFGPNEFGFGFHEKLMPDSDSAATKTPEYTISASIVVFFMFFSALNRLANRFVFS